MRSALRRHYDLGQRCRMISDGVSPHPAEPAAREPLVLAAGRMRDEAKGLDTLDAAARGLRWDVEVAGDRSAQHVALLGQIARTDLRARMGQAAIFAHPARYEPFGLVVLEAALAGCALVLGDIDSLHEQWKGAALFVVPGDSAALRAALERLIDDPRLRRQLADAACERAGRRQTRDVARSYKDLYRRVCARRRCQHEQDGVAGGWSVGTPACVLHPTPSAPGPLRPVVTASGSKALDAAAPLRVMQAAMARAVRATRSTGVRRGRIAEHKRTPPATGA